MISPNRRECAVETVTIRGCRKFCSGSRERLCAKELFLPIAGSPSKRQPRHSVAKSMPGVAVAAE